MAFVVKDRVKETCTSPGTGTVTLLGASTGYQSFSVIGNGNSTYYCIADQGGANWEVGIGTYTSSGTTLSRDTVLSSSNGGSKTNFTTGTQDVFVTYPSERSVYVNSAGSAITPDVASTLATTYGGTGLSSYTAGDLPYYATGTALSKLGIGTNGYVLTSTGSAPQWSAATGVAVTSISFGTTGLTPNSATQGAVTVAGTLATTNGGTGLTSFSANQIFFASSTSAVGQSASLTWDGTYLTAGSIKDSALTSGRVTYAGASGLLTDSANLTFDGTKLTAAGIKDSALTSGRVTYATTSGELTDSANLTFDGTYLTANSIKDSALTSGRVTYAGASGLLTDSANLTYDGTSLTAQALVASNGILVNNTTVAASYTIASGSNGMSVGPMTVNSGVTVTVSSGQRWLVL